MITFFHLFFSIFNKAFILQTYLYENGPQNTHACASCGHLHPFIKLPAFSKQLSLIVCSLSYCPSESICESKDNSPSAASCPYQSGKETQYAGGQPSQLPT